MKWSESHTSTEKRRQTNKGLKKGTESARTCMKITDKTTV
jgi:hypothetical protein